MRLPESAVSAITDFIFLAHPLKKADILFVPGGPGLEPAFKAAALYHEGMAPLILPSGLKSKVDDTTRGAYASEFEAIRHTLMSLGVPEKSILKEDRATYTYQNALFSREVLDARGLSIARAILVTKPVHARRAYMYYQSCFPDADLLACPCAHPITKENWFASREGIEAVFAEISRIGAYQGDLFLPV